MTIASNEGAKAPSSSVLTEGPEIVLSGKTYTMRRLSTKDVFKFAKIMGKVVAKIGTLDVGDVDPKNLTESNLMSIGMNIMTGLADADVEMAAFYGGVIGISGDEFMALPPADFTTFIDALQKHEDLMSFFGAVVRAVRAMGQAFQIS